MQCKMHQKSHKNNACANTQIDTLTEILIKRYILLLPPYPRRKIYSPFSSEPAARKRLARSRGSNRSISLSLRFWNRRASFLTQKVGCIRKKCDRINFAVRRMQILILLYFSDREKIFRKI